MSNEKEKEKDKKTKGRFLSPSFRKGAVKEKNEEEDNGEFKIDLIAAENDEDEDESKSPSPSKHRKKNKKDDKEKLNLVPVKDDAKDKDKKDQHRGSVTRTIPDDCKVNAIPEGRVKKVGSFSQAGKGEDGFTKVNQDSFLVLPNQYNFKDFNIFSVLDGHGSNGHLVSRFVTKYHN